jgi:hypothetical protein
LQLAGPIFAGNNSHKYGPAGPRNIDEKVMVLGSMRDFRLPPSHLAKMGEEGAPVCPGWVSKMFDGHCHQLFDASHGGPDQRLVRPLVNTLRTEHQDGQAPGGGGVYSYLSTAGDCSRGRIHQATSRLVGFRVVRCHGRKPWLDMWLCAVVSEKKTAAAQCTGQRRVVRPQGESPGCVLTFRRVFCCQSPLLPFPVRFPPVDRSGHIRVSPNPSRSCQEEVQIREAACRSQLLHALVYPSR